MVRDQEQPLFNSKQNRTNKFQRSIYTITFFKVISTSHLVCDAFIASHDIQIVNFAHFLDDGPSSIIMDVAGKQMNSENETTFPVIESGGKKSKDIELEEIQQQTEMNGNLEKIPAPEDVVLEMSPMTGHQVRGSVGSLELLSHQVEDVRKWIIKSFTKKICSYFVPSKVGSKQRCSCGLIKAQHEKQPLALSDETWVSKKHTEELPTDAFGNVTFTIEQQDSGIPAEYIRFSDTTSPEKVWMLMKEVWELKPPKLIVSILGGNQDSRLTPKLKKSIEEGLGKVLKSADTWLFTGATDTRITNLAGNVFNTYNRRERSHRNACIGMAPWGCIASKQELLGQMSEVLYMPAAHEQRKLNCLEKNQTHFILVDDGSVNRFGVERNFRAALEKYFCSGEGCRGIPTVNLLVGGGYTASKQIKQNMFSHPQIPIVIMRGSGGLADIIASARIAYLEQGKRGVAFLLNIKNKVKETLELDITDFKNAEVTSTVKQAVEEHSSHVIIYDAKNDPVGLDHAIFQACKAAGLGGLSCNIDHFSNLQLAILLDEIEMAKKDIDRESTNVEYLNKAFYKSLKGGKTDVVEFLFNFGIELERFLASDKNYLKKLYAKKLRQDHFLERLLCDGVSEDTYMEQIKKEPEDFDLAVIDDLLKYLMEEDYTPCYSVEENVRQLITPIQELMIWATLNNMVEMVECIWKQDAKNALENALVLHAIYKRMHKKCSFDEIAVADLQETSQKFRRRAVDLLSLYYKENGDSALDIIRTRIPLWGYKSFLTLAANAVAKELVGHTCSQVYLDGIWLGTSEKKTVKTEVARIQAKIATKPRPRAFSAAAKRNKKFARDVTDHKPKERVSKCVRVLRSIRSFFWFLFLVPKGKLFVHAVIYTLFLGCFGFLVLTKRGKYHSIMRYIVLVIVSALAIDEFRQLIEVRKKTWKEKFREWYSSFWNRLDFIAIVLFFVGFAFSFSSVKIEKILLAIDLVIWVVKFAQFYRMFKTLGPYLIMIYRMMFHMIGFVLVLIIAVIAYGIFMHALLFPNATISWQIVFKVLFRPYLLVFGELGINSYNLNTNSTVYGTKKLDEQIEIVVVIGMCVYLLIANVLLLNMLIAVFNNIYEETKENSDLIWRFDKYDMIMEFKNRPCLPIPLSVLTNIPRISFHLCSWEVTWVEIDDPEAQGRRTDLEDFKERCMKTYLHQMSRQQTETTQESLKKLQERVEGNAQLLTKFEEKFESRLVAMQKQLNTGSLLKS